MNIVIIIPSRGRPEQCFQAVGQIYATASNPNNVEVLVGVDADDPARYEKFFSARRMFRLNTSSCPDAQRQLTSIAEADGLLTQQGILAWGADDVRFETPGWDEQVIAEALAHPVSLIFGEDTIQHGHIATCPFFTQRFIRAIGGIYQAGYKHLYADTELTEIARMAGVLRYLPGMVTRHLHYSVGTAPSDATYARSERFNDDDKALFESRSRERYYLETLLRVSNT